MLLVARVARIAGFGLNPTDIARNRDNTMIPAPASVNRALMLAKLSSHFPFVEPGTMPERPALHRPVLRLSSGAFHRERDTVLRPACAANAEGRGPLGSTYATIGSLVVPPLLAAMLHYAAALPDGTSFPQKPRGRLLRPAVHLVGRNFIPDSHRHASDFPPQQA
jgi:hypothetical protein